jgi:hypothetical protein
MESINITLNTNSLNESPNKITKKKPKKFKIKGDIGILTPNPIMTNPIGNLKLPSKEEMEDALADKKLSEFQFVRVLGKGSSAVVKLA